MPGLSRRQLNDVALLRADIALAVGDLETANRSLAYVERSPANPLAAAWAKLGRAEHAHRAGTPGPTNEEVERDAARVGAWWLALQAKLGSSPVHEVTVGPSATRVRAVGNPRVLWLMT